MTGRFGNAVRGMPSPPVITPSSRCSLGGRMSRTGAGAAASGASPWSGAANVVIAVPFVLEATTTIFKAFWVMGTAGGVVNREVLIYDDAYTVLIKTGSVPGAGTNSVPQSSVFASSATLTLPPGRYYMGMTYNATTTNTHFRWAAAVAGIWQSLGCWNQASQTPGSTIAVGSAGTPADVANVALPMFGLITRTAYDV